MAGCGCGSRRASTVAAGVHQQHPGEHRARHEDRRGDRERPKRWRRHPLDQQVDRNRPWRLARPASKLMDLIARSRTSRWDVADGF